MKLDLDRTPTGRSDLPIEVQYVLELDPIGPDKVMVAGSLHVDNLESRCVVHGELAAIMTVGCGRCLQEYALGFSVPVEVVVLRDAGRETEDADTLVIHQRQGEIDLTDALREAVVLAVPQARICREDCMGLCARCGADLNDGPCSCVDDDVDPRWEGLPDLEDELPDLEDPAT
jgi:uncharacterized protein